MQSLLPGLPAGGHTALRRARAIGTGRLATHAVLQAQPEMQKSAGRIHTRVRYVLPPPSGEDLYSYVYDLPEGVDTPDNIHHAATEVTVTDLRQLPHHFNVLENGFQLVDFSVPLDIDWDSSEEVEARYYPLAADLLKQFAGASRVQIFDHTLRKGRSRADSDAPGESIEPAGTPVSRVHTDYTTFGGPRRLQMVLPDEAERLSKTPFAIYQIWRPLRSVVEESPLGFIDAATVAPKDLNVHRVEFPGRTGYNYAVSPNPDHRWYYTKHMRPDEAYVFVEYESRKGRARFTPHTGFQDPTTPPDAHPRESIELRALVFWEDAQPQSPEMEL